MRHSREEGAIYTTRVISAAATALELHNYDKKLVATHMSCPINPHLSHRVVWLLPSVARFGVVVTALVTSTKFMLRRARLVLGLVTFGGGGYHLSIYPGH